MSKPPSKSVFVGNIPYGKSGPIAAKLELTGRRLDGRANHTDI